MNDTRFDASQFKAGADVGNFHILKILGEGGMGAVFEAQDIKLGRKVALKVMHAHIATIPGAREKFLREARTAASVEHDRIVRIYSIHDDGQFPYITMELLQGESLHQYLARQRVPSLGFTLQVGLHVAQGLQVAHSAGLIHRDIKPSNIWIEPHDGSSFRCKILDFGLARGGTDGAISHATNQGMGTPMYMSPEQWQGVGLDGRSDLFSLGVILYQMGSGQMPFEGDTLPSIMFAVMQNEPQLVGALNPGLPKGLSQIIMKMLEKDKVNRPASGKEVAEVMGDMLRENERLLNDDPTTDPRERRLPSPEIETQTDVSLPQGVHSRPSDPAISAEFSADSANSMAEVPPPAPRLQVIRPGDSLEPPSILGPPRNHMMIGAILGIVLLALLVGIIAFWPKGDSGTPVVQEDPKKDKEKIEEKPKVDPKTQGEENPKKIVEPIPTPNKKPEVVPVVKKPGDPPPPRVTFLDSSGAVGLTPDTVTRIQRDYAEQAGLRVDYSLDLGNGVSMAFVLIPPGKFWMGAVPGEAAVVEKYAVMKRPPEPPEVPRHLVHIKRPFYLGKFEVRRAEFARFVTAFGYKTTAEATTGAKGWLAKDGKFSRENDLRFSWKEPGWTVNDDHPVVNVTWNDCNAFVEWAGHLPTTKFPDGFKRLRMVSEAQWEYAHRAGGQSIYTTGDDGLVLPKFANVADASLRDAMEEKKGTKIAFETYSTKDNHDFTSRVGVFPPNPLGVHDMTGNVIEWCRDGFVKLPESYLETLEDPEGPEMAEQRVHRGGSYLGWVPQHRISRRDEDKPDVRLYHLGFRLVIEP